MATGVAKASGEHKMVISGPGRESSHLLPDEWRSILLPLSRSVRVNAGQVILTNGAETRELYLVLEGSVRIALFEIGRAHV